MAAPKQQPLFLDAHHEETLRLIGIEKAKLERVRKQARADIEKLGKKAFAATSNPQEYDEILQIMKRWEAL